MKKLISVLLAISLMAMSTVAFAELNENRSMVAEGQRNSGADGTEDRNSNYFRAYAGTTLAPIYRPGDTITFKSGTDVTFAEGNVVTFISSKLGEDELNSSTVMFIDQVTVTAEEKANGFSYKIREGLAEGQYKIDIKNGDAAADTFYYAIGDPKVEVAYIDEDETVQYLYDEKDDKTYYFASAQLGTGDVTYNQLGVAEYGFDFGNDNVFTFDASVFDAAVAEQELTGSINWFFTIGLMDVDTENAPVADGAIVNE